MPEFPRRLFLDGPSAQPVIRQAELPPPTIGLATPLFVAGPGAVQRGAPQVTNNTTVNVPPPAPAPQPRTGVMGPQNDDERALVSQGGWAGASAAVQPLLGDWRTTPLQVISTALAGYNQGRYGAQQDLAANRQKQAELEAAQEELQMRRDAIAAKQAQAAALEASIARLPPDQQEKVRMLYGLGATEQAAKVISPDPVKREIVGGQEAGYFAIDPVSGESQLVQKGIGRAPTAPTSRYEMSNGFVLDKMTGNIVNIPTAAPEIISGKAAEDLGFAAGTVLQRGPGGKLDVLQKTPSGGYEVVAPDGTTIRAGAAAGAPKPPQGYRWTDNTFTSLEPIPGGPAEAAASEAAGKLAMLPGSLQDVQAVKDRIIDPKTGAVNRSAVVQANPPIPFVGALPTEAGRDIESRITGAIDTLIRARTGAAATEGEMSRMVNMYMPRTTDSDAVVKSKLDRLERDLNVMQEQFSRGKGGVENAVKVPENTPLSAPPPGGQAGPTASNAVVPQAQASTPADAEYNAMFGF